MRTSNIASRLSDFERHAREAAAEFNAKEFAKLGEPHTRFDFCAAAYLALARRRSAAMATNEPRRPA
jgi:hypothetical protein